MNVKEKLMNVQSKLKAPKSQINDFGHYNYRNCEDILEAVKPLVVDVKALLNLTDKLVLIGDRYYVESTATFEDTEKDGKIQSIGYAREEETKKGMDGSQITGASSSYARKYALNALFCIDDTKDSDTTNTNGQSNTNKTTANKANTKQSENNKAKTATENKSQTNSNLKCISCGKSVTAKVSEYSLSKYHKILCMDCQKKE